MTIKTILLSDIEIDGNTQSRVAINQEVVTLYADLMRDEIVFPPVIVFSDGIRYWLADGFHRFHATSSIGDRANILADVRKGTQRDAILFSLNANVPHGLSLTNDDKRKAVMIMLNDPEWSELTDRAIARHCGCSRMTVSRLRNPDAEKAAPSVTSDTAASIQPAPASVTSDTKPARESVPSDTPISLVSPQSSVTSAKINSVDLVTSDTEAAKKKAEDEQIAADAHGDADPVAMLEEAHKQIESLQGELFVLKADDQRAETLKYKRLADVAARRQGELMEMVNAREKELQRFANWLNRIGKALGEDDHAKLPALVEALKRGAK